MKEISQRHLHAPTFELAQNFRIFKAQISRIDHKVLDQKLPPPKLEKILVDEKYLGAEIGFVTLVVNAENSEPLAIVPGI